MPNSAIASPKEIVKNTESADEDVIRDNASLWLEAHADYVRQASFEAIEQFAVSDTQRILLRAILNNAFTAPSGGVDRCAIATKLPLLLFSAVKGDVDNGALALSVASTLLEAGIYTLDHIIDEELASAFADFDSKAVLLGAIDLISHVSYRAIIATGVAGRDLRDLLELFCAGLAKISAGQLCEIGLSYNDLLHRDNVLFAVSMKTGERRALYARLAVRLAHANDDVTQAAVDFALSLGCARQICSDLVDLIGAGPSRDLKSGALTLPLALLLEQSDEDGRRDLHKLLLRARQDESVQKVVRDRLREFGVLRKSVSITMSCCRESVKRLQDMRPLHPARQLLLDMVQDATPGGLPISRQEA